MKQIYLLCFLLITAVVFTSCSSPMTEEPEAKIVPEINQLEVSTQDQKMTVDSSDSQETSISVSSSTTDDSNKDDPVVPVDQIELMLFFADRTAVTEGPLGPYRFVTPVPRTVPATSSVLKAALEELIKGPLPEDKGVDPVIPNTAKLLGVSIENGIAYVDFNKAFAMDQAGGTTGGAITMQSIVFTAAQFDTVDGVVVNVEGEPWSDGHFIWDTPIYADSLYMGEELDN